MVEMELTTFDDGVLKLEKKPKMGTTILDCFNNLVNADNEHSRLNAGLTLLKHLSQQKAENLESKELHYSLRRLIRGLGSSRITSRKGFYITLTAYFRLNPDINISDILQIVDVELKSTNSNSKSENADIFMGRILLCGSLIRSKVLINQTVEDQQKITEIILNAGTKRSYLQFVSTAFFVDFISDMDVKSLKNSIWPLLEKELAKPWSEQTLDTFYALLVMNTKFPSLVGKKFLKQHLESEEIITSDTMANLLKLLTDIPRVICRRHPLYKIFCEKLASTDYIIEFWNGIDQRFVKPSKSIEHLALEVINLIIPNIKDKSIIPSLLSPNFMQHMLKRIISCKRNRNDEVSNAFRHFLTQLVTVLNDKEIKSKIPIAVLKRLIQYPGDMMIEKITGTKVIQMITHNMDASGVKKLSKFYNEIAANTVPKEMKGREVPWTNAERSYAGQLLTRLLGHSAVTTEHTWRLEQLKFLFNLGLCENTNVSSELAPQFKDSFYRALDHKLPKLADLRDVLHELVLHVNTELFQDKTMTLRTTLSEEALEAWKKVINFVTKLDENTGNKEVILIFYIMDLNMALQLFLDAEMAISSINEIHSCSERLNKKKPSKKNKKSKAEAKEDEPEWVEVIVDLLLSLLSQHSHLLRSLVCCVFPHMCPVLTAESIHQILTVLDPKDDKGPLVPKNGVDQDSDEESDDESDEDVDDDVENDENSNEDSESDMDIDDDDEENDETVNDRLRMAVQQALGGASIETDDEDIDIDEIDEEEGKRLDESLAAAFRILRENRQSSNKKQGKSAEALTHFRGRVIDLLEIYLESGPSMALALDMLVPLFALLEFCIKDPHQKPLENRVRSCLKKLSAVKKFKDTVGVNETLLTDLAKILIEKGERSTSICQEMGDKFAECCTFLIRCVQEAGLTSDALVEIYLENLRAFFKKRDCFLPASMFKNILQLYWDGNWQLVPLLVEYTFDNTIRSYRRGQALELLSTFYRNHRMVKSEEHTKIRQKMEKKLSNNTIKLFEELTHQNTVNGDSATIQNGNIGKEVRQKFISLLCILLHTIHPNHLAKSWDWTSIGNAMTEYRKQTSLSKDAKSAYNKLASRIGVSTNIKTQTTKERKDLPKTNGTSSEIEEVEVKVTENSKVTRKSDIKKKRKNSSKQSDKQKLKKEARELRAKTMAEGLDSIDFSNIELPNDNDAESMDVLC